MESLKCCNWDFMWQVKSENSFWSLVYVFFYLWKIFRIWLYLLQVWSHILTDETGPQLSLKASLQNIHLTWEAANLVICRNSGLPKKTTRLLSLGGNFSESQKHLSIILVSSSPKFVTLLYKVGLLCGTIVR